LLVATALTATSVGVAAAAWASHDALDTPDGDLMLDVAELDDLSAVLLMAIVLALVSTPEPLDGWLPSLIAAGSSFAIKFAAFGGLCYLFAKYVEEPLTRFAAARKRAPQRMLIVAGAAFVIAAVAEWLEFSLAIGALFAGLMFSRDPQAVRTEAGFDDIHDFLMPFFFVGIGLTTDLGSIGNAWMLGAVFLAVAVTGKILGAALPALLVTTKRSALLIGFSMVPRAEIALVIAYHGLALGLLDQRTYAAMVLVSIATCIVATWLLEALLGRADHS
jgi:Kef-type K+ transport system membrane component KefB